MLRLTQFLLSLIATIINLSCSVESDAPQTLRASYKACNVDVADPGTPQPEFGDSAVYVLSEVKMVLGDMLFQPVCLGETDFLSLDESDISITNNMTLSVTKNGDDSA